MIVGNGRERDDPGSEGLWMGITSWRAGFRVTKHDKVGFARF